MKRSGLALGLVLTLLAGCGSSKRSGNDSATAGVSSSTSTAPTSSSTTPAPPPPPATTPPTAPPPATSGSGGSGGALGLTSRTVTTQAQAGFPAISVDYTLYAPSGYTVNTPVPLVLAANMGLTPWQGLAENETFIAIDFRDHDRNGGFNFNYDVLLINAILADVQGAYNVDTKRIYYHGFSAGAHWGYTVVLSNTQVFAGLGINAGSMSNAVLQGVWPGQVQRQIPVAIRHGVSDAVVPIGAGRDDRGRLMGAGHPLDYAEFAGGHSAPTAQQAAEIWAFLSQYSLP